MPGEELLLCTNIRKSYDSGKEGGAIVQVLLGVNLRVERGEMVAVIGASGSGKSTLLHILGGLDRPTDGNVFWSGADISSWDDQRLASERAKNVGFVFQFHHLLPEFTALENVVIPQLIVGTGPEAARARAAELLGKVGVDHRSGHRPSELSGGEQQRVAVARALANAPALVLADEPTGNLDSKQSGELHELLFELNRTERQTFVLVTHNEQLAARAGRTCRMADGILQPV